MTLLLALIAIPLFVWALFSGAFENSPPNHISRQIRDSRRPMENLVTLSAAFSCFCSFSACSERHRATTVTHNRP